jgi:hypothetical protein
MSEFEPDGWTHCLDHRIKPYRAVGGTYYLVMIGESREGRTMPYAELRDELVKRYGAGCPNVQAALVFIRLTS